MKNIWMILTAASVFVADQLSKLVVMQIMNLPLRGEIEILPPYINFRMAWNRGVNFGLFAGEGEATRWLLIAVAVAISAWVALWIGRGRFGAAAQVSAGFLIGGAAGNVIDRITYGAVADFLNMSCCGFTNPYAFNIADIGVFAGAFGLILFANEKKPA